ncbi:MAG: hypothetical protein RLZZ299_2283 [Pseudomonadota bacterium]|jgi:hypothetical protein
MRSLSLLLLGLPVLGCFSGDDAEQTGGGGSTARTFADFVDVQTPWTGDSTCFDGTTFSTAVPDPSCQQPITLSGVVSDFEKETPVGSAAVQIWTADAVAGAADSVLAADADGVFSVEVQACTPFAYGTSTPPEWAQTVDTYEIHQLYGFDGSGGAEDSFNSVSIATSRVIAGLIGVDWDPATAIIAGKAYDCALEPIQYAQVYLHDADGNPPATGDVYYFTANGGTDLPAQRAIQPHTNTNGLWVAMNVPPGAWIVELWAWDAASGAHVLLGKSPLDVAAGAVTVSNLYTGEDDGVYYPSSCLQACGG